MFYHACNNNVTISYLLNFLLTVSSQQIELEYILALKVRKVLKTVISHTGPLF